MEEKCEIIGIEREVALLLSGLQEKNMLTLGELSIDMFERGRLEVSRGLVKIIFNVREGKLYYNVYNMNLNSGCVEESEKSDFLMLLVIISGDQEARQGVVSLIEKRDRALKEIANNEEKLESYTKSYVERRRVK